MVKIYLVGKVRLALLIFTRLFWKVPILLHTEQIGRVFIGVSVLLCKINYCWVTLIIVKSLLFKWAVMNHPVHPSLDALDYTTNNGLGGVVPQMLILKHLWHDRAAWCHWKIRVVRSKGQLISKTIYGVLDSPKKRTKTIWFVIS